MSQLIDNAWLSANTTAFPTRSFYSLGVAFGSYTVPVDNTYVLGVDITTSGASFITCKSGLSLNISGHKITYDDGPYLGDSIVNHNFETGNTSGWNMTYAQSGQVINWVTGVFLESFNGKMHGLEGTYCLQFNGINEHQRLISSPIAISNTGIEYTIAVICRSISSTTSISGSVYDIADSGFSSPIALVPNDNFVIYSNGECYQPGSSSELTVTFPDDPRINPVPTGIVFVLDISPTVADKIIIDDIVFSASRCHGILAPNINWGAGSFSSRCPAQYQISSINNVIRSFNLYSSEQSGTITQGKAKSWQAECLFAWALTQGLTVSNINFNYGSNQNSCINCNGCAINLLVSGCTFYPNMTRMRTRKYPKLVVDTQNSNGNVIYNIVNNYVSGICQAFTLAGNVSSCLIDNNEIYHHSFWGDPYAIAIGKSVTNFIISNNTIIAQISARGMILDGSGGTGQPFVSGQIYNNYLESKEQCNLENLGDGIYPVSLRVRNYTCPMKDISIHDNIFIATSPGIDYPNFCVGCRLSHYNSNVPVTAYASGCVIENNTFKGLALYNSGKANSGAQAFSVELTQSPNLANSTLQQPGWIIRNNILESNYLSLNIGGPDNDGIETVRNILFQNNTCRKSTEGTGLGYQYSSIWMGNYGPASSGGVYLISTNFDQGAAESYSLLGSSQESYQRGDDLQISVSDQNSNPLQNAMCVVSDINSNIIGSGYTDIAGSALWSFYLGGYLPSTYFLPVASGLYSSTGTSQNNNPALTLLTPHTINVSVPNSSQTLVKTVNNNLNIPFIFSNSGVSTNNLGFKSLIIKVKYGNLKVYI